MKQILVKGATSVITFIFIQDSSSTVGAGLTGLAYNTGSLVGSYIRPGGTRQAFSLVTQTVGGAFSAGGFIEVDSTNMPGVYRLDIVDAVLAVGVDNAVIMIKGATNMAPLLLEIQLTDLDLNTASAPQSADNDTKLTSVLAKMLAYVRLMVRKDAAVETDAATELTAINNNEGAGGGAYSAQSEAQEALRDRGDAAWTTGGGGSVSQSAKQAGYVGDYEIGETVEFAFSTTDTLTPGATVNVYKDDGNTAVSPGLVTLEEDFGSETNVHQVSIALVNTSYDPDADYEVILSEATIGIDTVSAVIATFSIQNRFRRSDIRETAK